MIQIITTIISVSTFLIMLLVGLWKFSAMVQEIKDSIKRQQLWTDKRINEAVTALEKVVDSRLDEIEKRIGEQDTEIKVIKNTCKLQHKPA